MDLWTPKGCASEGSMQHAACSLQSSFGSLGMRVDGRLLEPQLYQGSNRGEPLASHQHHNARPSPGRRVAGHGKWQLPLRQQEQLAHMRTAMFREGLQGRVCVRLPARLEGAIYLCLLPGHTSRLRPTILCKGVQFRQLLGLLLGVPGLEVFRLQQGAQLRLPFAGGCWTGLHQALPWCYRRGGRWTCELPGKAGRNLCYRRFPTAWLWQPLL